MEEIEAWLKSLGYDVDNMTYDEMLEAEEDEMYERALDAAWDKYEYNRWRFD